MGHPEIENRTPFSFQPLYLSDEDGRPLFVVLVQATYALSPGAEPELLEEQPPISLAGEPWDEEPASTYRIEAPGAFTKLATDVVLAGHALAPKSGATQSTALLRVGRLEKVATVTGDRTWVRAAGGIAMTRPLPFEKIPLRWERAFGGWDTSGTDPSQHACEPRNPCGTGFRRPGGAFEEGIRLPNVEDPEQRIERWGQIAEPVGFGVVPPHFAHRKAYAGTFDAKWKEDRSPLLPADFDRRFFSSAPPGLVASGYLRGGEAVTVLGATPEQRLAFALPELRRPVCRAVLAGHAERWIEPVPDTVIVDTDARRLTILYRGYITPWKSVHEVHAIEVGARPPKGVRLTSSAAAAEGEARWATP